MAVLPFFMIFLVYLLLSFTGAAYGFTWRGEQEIFFYESYSSLSFMRFSIPSHVREAKWQFRATKDPNGCDDERVQVALQFGSLAPLTVLNETFPDKFFLKRSRPTELALGTNNISVLHKELLPLDGDWYAVAVIPERSNEIKQKGLSEECKYKVSASVEVDYLPSHVLVGVNGTVQVALTTSRGDSAWVGLTVPKAATQASLLVSNCSSPSPCLLQLTLTNQESGRPIRKMCNVSDSPCSFPLTSVSLGKNQYLQIQLLSSSSATVSVHFTAAECPAKAGGAGAGSMQCGLEPALDRYQGNKAFQTVFLRMVNDTVRENRVALSNTSVTMVPFTVKRITDIGGTLHVRVSFHKQDVPEGQRVRVCGGFLFHQLLSVEDDLCVNASRRLLASSSQLLSQGYASSQISVPYPEEGTWVLALTMQCVIDGLDEVQKSACVNGSMNVTLSIGIRACVHGKCSDHGECRFLTDSSDFVFFSSCNCFGGWRGYGCTDNTEAQSSAAQIMELLMLTLSNLFFLPAICLAAYRSYFLESLVYLYTMFFSTFYHACDGNRILSFEYCMMEYSTLADCDFLGSTTSLWVTVLAMAELRLDVTAALQMVGGLWLVMGVLLDRHSLWVILVPALISGGIVLWSWGQRCRGSKRCYPSKKRWLFMAPGFLVFTLAIAFFAFLETKQNYKYVHSFWHICISTAIVFFLPPDRHHYVHFTESVEPETYVYPPQIESSTATSLKVTDSLEVIKGGGRHLPNELLTHEEWISLWNATEVSIHMNSINTTLEKYAPLMINGRSRVTVFVPMCGKSLDMIWFTEKGHRVIGVDPVQKTVEDFFKETHTGFISSPYPAVNGRLFESVEKKLQIYCCDIFKISKAVIGKVDCIWDRGALNAVKVEDRERYAGMIRSVMSAQCRHLITALQFSAPSDYKGTIIHLPEDAIRDCFENFCTVEEIGDRDMNEPYKALKFDWIREKVYLLSRPDGSQPTDVLHSSSSTSVDSILP